MSTTQQPASTKPTASAVPARRGTRTAQSGQTTGARAKQWRIDMAGLGFVLPFFALYALFQLWPIILGLRMSFFNWSLLGSGTTHFLGLRNYQELFRDPAFWGALRNTAIFALMSTPILVVLGFALAALANRAKRLRWLFRLAFFAPYMLPVSVVALIWVWLYEPDFGLINSYLTSAGLGSVNWLAGSNVAMLSVVIATVWWTLGFNFILYLAGLQEIDPQMYEAASIDGASAWARLRHITVPLLNRTTVLVIILQVLSSLKVFAQIYLMTIGGPNNATRPIVQYIYETGFGTYRVGYASAMSYIFFLLIIAVSLIGFALLRPRQEEAA